MKIVNLKNVIVAFVFGLLAFFTISSQLFFIVPGTNLVTDPREIFVTIGSALSGPAGGIIIGILSTIINPTQELVLYVMLQHVFGAVLIGYLYKKLIFEKTPFPFFILSWTLLIFCYYFLFYIPIFSLYYFFYPTFIQALLEGQYTYGTALLKLYEGWFNEYLITTIITSLIFIGLPERYRYPLWGKTRAPKKLKLKIFGRKITGPSALRNFLAIRLIIWFLLLAIIPILIMGITIKNDMMNSLLEHEAVFRLAMANGYKDKFKELTPREAINLFKEAQRSLSGNLFLMDYEGNYALAADSSKQGAYAGLDYSPAIIQRMIAQKNGSIIDRDNHLSFGFASLNSSKHDLLIVVTSNKQTVSEITAALSSMVHKRLSFGLVIISFALVFIIWLFINVPVTKFRRIIDAFAKGDYEARVPIDAMNDEIKILGLSFNDMAEKIHETNRKLKDEIEQRAQAEKTKAEMQACWEFAVESAGDGLWDWNIQTGKVFFSDQWKKMLGFETDEITDSIEEWSARVHPDDLQKSREELNKHLNGEIPLYLTEHRMKCKDGSYKWILDRGKLIKVTDEGKPIRMIGIHTDIDSQKKLLIQLENRNVFIQNILDNLPIGLAVNEIDSGRASYMNKKFIGIYGWEEKILTDITQFFEAIYPDAQYRKEITERIIADIKSGNPDRMKWDNVRITTQKGEERFVSAVNIPIVEQNIMVSTVQDVTDSNISRDKMLAHTNNLSTLLDISRVLISTLNLDVVLQTIIERITDLIDLDSGALYLIDGDNLFLASTSPPLEPSLPEIFRHAALSEHHHILKCIQEQKPVYVYDTKKVELSPSERKIIETREFRTLLYLPLIAGEKPLGVLIIGTVGSPKMLTEQEIELCSAVTNISSLAVANAKLYKNSLQNVMNLEAEMKERKRVEAALRESETLLSAIVDTAKDSIFVKDTSGKYIRVNASMASLFDMKAEDIIGKTNKDMFGLTSDENAKEIDYRVLQGETIEDYPVKLIKGSELHFHSIKVPLKDSGGSIIGICGIARDITERIKSEEQIKNSLKEKEILLKEVHHRVKNNFQLINNMLYLEGDFLQEPKLIKIFAEVQNRIRSLSLVHEILYTTLNFGTVNLKDYVHALLEFLQRSLLNSFQRISINVDVDDILMEPDTIIPCGLIINELITNSIKYAFHNRADGLVTIKLKKQIDKHILSVSDNGAGLPDNFDIENNSSFGLYLVKTLAQQIGGKLSVESSARGALFKIIF